MATIGARGATEVARIRTESEAGYTYLWVMTSDGRVLKRCITKGVEDGYTVYRRKIPENARNTANLMTLANNLNHKVVS